MSVIDVVRRFSRPSVCCEKRILEQVHRATEILRQAMREGARRFIGEHSRRPLLLQYGADLTPLVTRERFMQMVGDLSVVRAGHNAHELLIQRLFFQSEGKRFVVVEVPIDMHEKTTLAHFGAARALLNSARELEQVCLCVTFHKYDGALQAPLARLHKAFMTAWDDKQAEQGHEGERYRMCATSWFLTVGCFAHDVHGSSKWSILRYTQDKQLLRSCSVAHESLRQGYRILVKHLGTWLQEVIAFKDWRNSESRRVCELLGAPDDWLELYVGLDIRFEDGRPFVAERWRDRDDMFDVIGMLMLKTWRFVRFSQQVDDVREG